MEHIFLTILSMSGTASLVVLVVLLARLLLRRAPKVFSYALWAVVLFRLLCPFAIQSRWSMAPSIQVEPAQDSLNLVEVNMKRAEVVIRVDDSPADHPQSGTPAPFGISDGAEPIGSAPDSTSLPNPWSIASAVWLAGAALLLGYSVLSTLRLRRRLAESMPLEGEKNVRLADHIPSPFVLGIFRPQIYLPSGLPEGERDYILLHERTHIRRFDHIFRALAWLALAIHWFNPLVWLSFHLAGKDMEMSCDEAVLRRIGRDVRADYSSSLLRLSTGKRLPAGPLAFGDGDPQNRIKNVLRYKKPALWVTAAALIVVLCAGVALATDRPWMIGPGKPADFVYHEPGPAELWVDMTDYPQDEPWPECIELQMPEYPGVTFRWTREMVTAVIEGGESPLPEGLGVTEDGQSILFLGETIWSVYLCDLNGDGRRDMCFTADLHNIQHNLGCWFGYNTFSSGFMDHRYDHFLRLEGDQLWVEERDRKSGEVIRSGPLARTKSGLDIVAETPPFGENSPAAGLTCVYNGDHTSVVVTGYEAERAEWFFPDNSQFMMETMPYGCLCVTGAALDGGLEDSVCYAFWSSEERNAVKMELLCHMEGGPVTLDYTVLPDLPPEQAIIDRKVLGVQESDPHLSNEVVVELAQRFASYLQAAESWHSQQQQTPPDDTEPYADLTFSIVGETDPSGPVVRISGTVDGVDLGRTTWSPPGRFGEPYPLGLLWFEQPLCGGEVVCPLDACWTDESCTAVRVTATPRAMFSSYSQAGNLIITVDLSGNGGVLVEMEGHIPKLAPGLPELLPTEEEAVQAALTAATLMTAAEDYYQYYLQDQPGQPLEPYYYVGELGEFLVGGVGTMHMTWDTPSWPGDTDWLYFAGNPAVLCPGLAGEAVEGSARWTDKSRSALRVNFEVNDERVPGGAISGFTIEFTVNLESLAVTDTFFRSRVEGETLELTDQEMLDMAQTLAGILNGAEAYFYDGAPDAVNAPAG